LRNGGTQNSWKWFFRKLFISVHWKEKWHYKGYILRENLKCLSIIKDVQIGTRRVDFLVEQVVSVELKALVIIEDVHLAQAINYLEAYNLEIGMLINFGAKSLQFKRLINPKFNSNQINRNNHINQKF